MGYTRFTAMPIEDQIEQLRRTVDSINGFEDKFMSDIMKEELERSTFYGSHMDRNHSGLSQEDMIKRLLHDKVVGSSSYASQEQAHEIVKEMLYAKAKEIVQFINMGELDSHIIDKFNLKVKTEIYENRKIDKLVLDEEIEAEDPDEIPYVATGITNDFRYMGTNVSRMIVVKAPLNDMNFRILTCIPLVDKGVQLEPKSKTLEKINKALINDDRLSDTEKSMWLYKEMGYQTFRIGDTGAIGVMFDVNGHAFSLKLNETSFGRKNPFVSLKTERGYENAFTTEKIDEATRHEATKKANELVESVYNKVVLGNIKFVSDEIIKNEKNQEKIIENQKDKNNNILDTDIR